MWAHNCHNLSVVTVTQRDAVCHHSGGWAMVFGMFDYAERSELGLYSVDRVREYRTVAVDIAFYRDWINPIHLNPMMVATFDPALQTFAVNSFELCPSTDYLLW